MAAVMATMSPGCEDDGVEVCVCVCVKYRHTRTAFSSSTVGHTTAVQSVEPHYKATRSTETNYD